MDLEQFELWLRPGVLGFYRSCEVTACGLLDHDGRAHNLFTILVFEDRELASGEPVFLTKKKREVWRRHSPPGGAISHFTGGGG